MLASSEKKPVAKRKSIARGKKKASTENVDALILYVRSKLPEGLTDQEWLDKHTEHRFHETRRWRFDVAIPRLMLAVEYEGGTFGRKSRHTSGVGFSSDAIKYSTAASMGWFVLRFCADHVKSGECYGIIDAAINRLTKGEMAP